MTVVDGVEGTAQDADGSVIARYDQEAGSLLEQSYDIGASPACCAAALFARIWCLSSS
jgi:hypothetical protein